MTATWEPVRPPMQAGVTPGNLKFDQEKVIEILENVLVHFIVYSVNSIKTSILCYFVILD